jgi:hypothetical protein
MPSSEQLVMPRTKTQPRVNHSEAPVGSRSLKMNTPTSSRMTASAKLAMATSATLPMK